MKFKSILHPLACFILILLLTSPALSVIPIPPDEFLPNTSSNDKNTSSESPSNSSSKTNLSNKINSNSTPQFDPSTSASSASESTSPSNTKEPSNKSDVPNSNSDPKTNTSSSSDSSSNPELPSNTDSNSSSNTKSHSGTSSDPVPKKDSSSNTDSNSNSDSHIGSDSSSNNDSKTESDSNSSKDSDIESDSTSNNDSDTKPDSNSNKDSDTKSDSNSSKDSDNESNSSSNDDPKSNHSEHTLPEIKYLPKNRQFYAISSSKGSIPSVTLKFDSNNHLKISYTVGFVFKKDKNYCFLSTQLEFILSAGSAKFSVGKSLLMPPSFNKIKFSTNRNLQFESPYILTFPQNFLFLISFPVMEFTEEAITTDIIFTLRKTIKGFNFNTSHTLKNVKIMRNKLDLETYADYKDAYIEGRLPKSYNVNQSKPGQEDVLHIKKLPEIKKNNKSGKKNKNGKNNKNNEEKVKTFFKKYTIYIVVGVILVAILGYFIYTQPSKPQVIIPIGKSVGKKEIDDNNENGNGKYF